MTLQVIAQAVATLLFALTLCRGAQTLGIRPVPLRTKRTRD